MKQIVTFSLYFLLYMAVGAHGRVAFTDLSDNRIDKIATDLDSMKTTIIYVKVANKTDLGAVTKAIIEINANATTSKSSHDTENVRDNEIRPDDNEPGKPVNNVDNGTALILTPYIEEGRISEGRIASKVDPNVFLGVKSYSGFLTVNKTYNSNLFFWYFPVENKPVNETPWIIWLQGGPGASSLSGLFDEFGPFTYHPVRGLYRNPYTWLRDHSLVFLENPVGTGYSFTNHKDGYARDMATYTSHLYSALRQLLQLYPELRAAPLYVAGESYAGKYVPALSAHIHAHKSAPGGDVNLKGLILGNAFIEPTMIQEVPQTFYNFGLLTREQLDILQPIIDEFRDVIRNNKSIEAKEKWHQLVNGLLAITQQKQAYNFLTDEFIIGKYETFLQRSIVKRALHVGDIKWQGVNVTVNLKLAPDFLSNTRPKIESLLNHYNVLVYCGQLDQMLSCPVAAEHHRKWQWNQSDQFRNATRMPYILNRRLAGYHKSGGRLTEALVRGAGHMAPADAPAAVQRLVTRWTHAQPLDTDLRYNLNAINTYLADFSRAWRSIDDDDQNL